MGIKMQEAMLSRGPNGEARFDYSINGSRNTLLIERVGEGVLETLFDENGATLKQVLLKGGSEVINAEVNEMANRIKGLKETEYEEVVPKMDCPHCGSRTLKRYINIEDNSVPIIPTYICTSCGGRSYHLTDQYLKDLVYENKEVFSDDEKKDLESNEQAFFKELKEYIIRIFASKKIIAIR